jgi:tetratricopeptide (TPR) repeat protein
MNRWAEAADAFDRALQMAPDDEAALRARARARDERGLRSGAAADYERLAFVLDIAGRAPDAAEAARRAARLEPSPARDALADRLQLAAAQQADLQPALARSFGGIQVSELDAEAGEVLADDEDVSAAAPGDADAAAPDDDLIDEPQATQASLALAARIAELGTQPKWVDMDGRSIGEDGGVWPAIDLPSMPDELVEGPRPDPETLLAVAADLLDAGDVQSARDLMLTAVMVHREEGRVHAALEICLRLLAAAPGDPKVHLAIANLQLDRGWTAVATEKIELLKRLTALTGDTQAEADVHFLASERLREGLPT